MHLASVNFLNGSRTRAIPALPFLCDHCFDTCTSRCCDWRRFFATYSAASRVSSANPSNQRLLCQPTICSLHLARPTGRIAMPSSSPQSSSSQPQHRSKGAKARLDTDANIHNFAPVARIMKTALPENAKIAKEAKECMQECVSEFISFITSEGTSPALGMIRYWLGG